MLAVLDRLLEFPPHLSDKFAEVVICVQFFLKLLHSIHFWNNLLNGVGVVIHNTHVEPEWLLRVSPVYLCEANAESIVFCLSVCLLETQS